MKRLQFGWHFCHRYLWSMHSANLFLVANMNTLFHQQSSQIRAFPSLRPANAAPIFVTLRRFVLQAYKSLPLEELASSFPFSLNVSVRQAHGKPPCRWVDTTILGSKQAPATPYAFWWKNSDCPFENRKRIVAEYGSTYVVFMAQLWQQFLPRKHSRLGDLAS